MPGLVLTDRLVMLELPSRVGGKASCIGGAMSIMPHVQATCYCACRIVVCSAPDRAAALQLRRKLSCQRMTTKTCRSLYKVERPMPNFGSTERCTKTMFCINCIWLYSPNVAALTRYTGRVQLHSSDQQQCSPGMGNTPGITPTLFKRARHCTAFHHRAYSGYLSSCICRWASRRGRCSR